MMIKKELNELKERDVYSLLLFALFKLQNIPEYCALSELSYVLDKNNFLNLCEYFGGTTITIPTIEEIEFLVDALLLYQYIDVEKIPKDVAYSKIKTKSYDIKRVIHIYDQLRKLLIDYDFSTRK